MNLESEFAERRMTARAAAKRPVVFALAVFDRQIVDAGDAQAHQAVLVEFPVLVAVAAKPVAAVVVPFIGEAHADAVLPKGPDLLDQSVVELPLPFAGVKVSDRGPALHEFASVSPPAVACMSAC